MKKWRDLISILLLSQLYQEFEWVKIIHLQIHLEIFSYFEYLIQ